MATVYTWDVATVDTKVSHTDDNSVQKDDVIFNIHWRLTGTDDNNSETLIGVQEMDITDLSSFTEFDDVTTSDVEGWLETELGTDQVQSLKDNIQASLTEKGTPTTVTRIIGE